MIRAHSPLTSQSPHPPLVHFPDPFADLTNNELLLLLMAQQFEKTHSAYMRGPLPVG